MKMFYGLDSKHPSQRAASGMGVWNDTLGLGGGISERQTSPSANGPEGRFVIVIRVESEP